MTCPDGWKVIIVAEHAEPWPYYCNLCAQEKEVTHTAYVEVRRHKTIQLQLCAECAETVKTWPKV